jgi:dTDP-4-dehydrorhamnose 3,5-epimerase
MEIMNLDIPGVYLIKPHKFTDERGFFMETYESLSYEQMIQMPPKIIQINHSKSCKGTLRGLHYQLMSPQGKLVRAIRGTIMDVAVDLRRKSNTFGKWVRALLSGDNSTQIYIPPGLAHGFYVLSDMAEVEYACTNAPYCPDDSYSIYWNDPDLDIEWPAEAYVSSPLLSPKDEQGLAFKNAPYYQ